ncbi:MULTISPECIES: hypothetical protein [Geobacter]|nr:MULTISPECIES: hypothetical protein [Geobacter]
MGKRMTKAEANALVWLIIIGLPLFVVVKFIEAIGVVTFAIGGAVIVAFAFWYTSSRSKARQLEMERLREEQRIASLREAEQRRLALTAKYADPLLIEKIMSRHFWQGQTEEQLRDSLGHPYDIDERVLKTKSKQIWKYHPMGRNRFGLRITLENGLVVGWDDKT